MVRAWRDIYRGELQETFKTMKVSRDMRLSWLQRWQSMDKDGSKLLDYTEFVQTCGLQENLWSRRMFDLLDKNFTGKTMQYYVKAAHPQIQNTTVESGGRRNCAE